MFMKRITKILEAVQRTAIIAIVAVMAVGFVGCPDPDPDETLSSTKAVTAFSFASPPATGEIDETEKTISVTVPHGTVVTNLTPTVTHTGVSYSPTTAQNFTTPVTYTVTAEDGSTQGYVVTVIVQSPVPTYGIELFDNRDNTPLTETSTLDFGFLDVGYNQWSYLFNVDIKNIGNQPTGQLSLGVSDTDKFSLVITTHNSINKDASGFFTIMPVGGLLAGRYSATVTVSGNNGIDESFDVNFVVRGEPKIYYGSILPPGTIKTPDNIFFGDALPYDPLVVEHLLNGGETIIVDMTNGANPGMMDKIENGEFSSLTEIPAVNSPLQFTGVGYEYIATPKSLGTPTIYNDIDLVEVIGHDKAWIPNEIKIDGVDYNLYNHATPRTVGGSVLNRRIEFTQP